MRSTCYYIGLEYKYPNGDVLQYGHKGEVAGAASGLREPGLSVRFQGLVLLYPIELKKLSHIYPGIDSSAHETLTHLPWYHWY
eukprot:gene11608-biopygen4135